MIVREAIAADKRVFLELTCQLAQFNRARHSDKHTYDDFPAVLSAICCQAEQDFAKRDQDRVIFIALKDGNPVGFGLARIYQEEERADNGTGRMGLLDQLFVTEAVRGMGAGKLIVDKVLEWLSNQGITRVKLHTYSWNRRAAKLYQSLGFKEYAVSMEKFLD